MLFDTVAEMPIWTDGEMALREIFGDDIVLEREGAATGIGGKTQGKWYRINFQLGEVQCVQHHGRGVADRRQIRAGAGIVHGIHFRKGYCKTRKDCVSCRQDNPGDR